MKEFSITNTFNFSNYFLVVVFLDGKIVHEGDYLQGSTTKMCWDILGIHLEKYKVERC